MRRFLRDLGLFVLVQAALGGGLLWGALQRIDDQDYLAATHDKHRLLEEAPSPRVIFVGGSSTAFGLDGRVLHKLLPTHYPVNMGLHIELGTEFMLNEVADKVRPGDLVVVALEYDPFLRHQGSAQILKLAEHRPRSLAYVNLVHASEIGLQYLGQLTRRGIKYYQGRDTDDEELPYARRGFSKRYGDLTMHHGKTPADFARGFSSHTFNRHNESPKHLARTAGLLNAFHATCRRKGARVVLVCPPYVREHLAQRHSLRRSAEWVNAQLRNRLDFAVLDTPMEAAQPREDFFDTPYHLSGAGARKRSRRLAGLLNDFLRSDPATGQ